LLSTQVFGNKVFRESDLAEQVFIVSAAFDLVGYRVASSGQIDQAKRILKIAANLDLDAGNIGMSQVCRKINKLEESADYGYKALPFIRRIYDSNHARQIFASVALEEIENYIVLIICDREMERRLGRVLINHLNEAIFQTEFSQEDIVLLRARTMAITYSPNEENIQRYLDLHAIRLHEQAWNLRHLMLEEAEQYA